MNSHEQSLIIIKQGWLRKKGKNLVQKWPMRWVELITSNLSYFRKQNDPKPAGCINTVDLDVTKAHSTERMDHVFHVNVKNRTYQFSASSMREMDDWVQAIRHARQRAFSIAMGLVETDEQEDKGDSEKTTLPSSVASSDTLEQSESQRALTEEQRKSYPASGMSLMSNKPPSSPLNPNLKVPRVFSKVVIDCTSSVIRQKRSGRSPLLRPVGAIAKSERGEKTAWQPSVDKMESGSVSKNYHEILLRNQSIQSSISILRAPPGNRYRETVVEPSETATKWTLYRYSASRNEWRSLNILMEGSTLFVMDADVDRSRSGEGVNSGKPRAKRNFKKVIRVNFVKTELIGYEGGEILRQALNPHIPPPDMAVLITFNEEIRCTATSSEDLQCFLSAMQSGLDTDFTADEIVQKKETDRELSIIIEDHRELQCVLNGLVVHTHSITDSGREKVGKLQVKRLISYKWTTMSVLLAQNVLFFYEVNTDTMSEPPQSCVPLKYCMAYSDRQEIPEAIRNCVIMVASPTESVYLKVKHDVACSIWKHALEKSIFGQSATHQDDDNPDAALWEDITIEGEDEPSASAPVGIQMYGKQWALRLISEQGETVENGAVELLLPGRNPIGRSVENGIRLKDPKASRDHATILVDGSKIALVDGGGKRGTHVNGSKFTRGQLKEKDEIRFGTSIYVIELLDRKSRVRRLLGKK